MKSRPILFSGPMVRAILDGRKTQTRRVVKPQPELGQAFWGGALDDVNVFRTRHKTGGWHHCDPITFAELYSPYGQPGHQLRVRETWRTYKSLDHVKPSNLVRGAAIEYQAGGSNVSGHPRPLGLGKWRPSIFLPTWASRITLEITAVRVERLQDISEADAVAEGVTVKMDAALTAATVPGISGPAHLEYFALWQSINSPGSWDANPWVWVVEFKKLGGQE